MRMFWFGPKAAAATACFVMLSLAITAKAQNNSESDRDDSAADGNRNRSTPREGRDENNSGRRSGQNSRSEAQQGHSTLGVVLYNDNSNPLEIRRVLPNSAAENAGLERGDEIITINGRRLSSVEQLKRAVERAGNDQEMEIGILRDGRKRTVEATLSTRRSARGRNQWQQNDGRFADQQYGQRGRMQGYEQDYGGYENEGWNDRDERFANRGQQYSEEYGRAGNQGYSRGSRRAGSWREDDGDDRYAEGYRGAEDGDRAFLGVTLDERARDGAVIHGVYPESPADKAGLRPGDDILAIDDEEVQSNHDLQHLLSQRDPDDDVTISVERNGRKRTLHATLASQREVFEASRQANRTRRRSSYQENYSERDNYRDGSSNNRRRQRDNDEEQDDDNY